MGTVQPKLRFPEFNEAWKSDKLINLTEMLRCGIAATPEYVLEGVPFLSAQNVTSSGEISLHKYNNISNEYFKILSKNNNLKKGDILYSRVGAGYGSAAIFPYDGDYGVYVSLTHIRVNQFLKNDYLQQYLNSPLGKEQASNGVFQGGGVPNLNVKVVEKFNISYPNITEQTRIANFLSAVDEKLNLLKEKKTLLEAYKKGITQKIFKQEIRFKDDNGNDFEDWKVDNLGNISKIYDGTHQTPKYVSEGIAFYSVEHVTANQFSNTKFITETVFDKENKRVQLQKGDILMTRIGSIGVAKYINWDVKASFYVSLALIKKNENINNEYLCHFINSPFFQNELWERTIHVAFPKKINLGEIGDCLVKFPTLKEQNKIAKFLSAIDEKISLVSNQIQDTQEYKKGLLQQMFV
jgi:type I restriction enzyme S subunit